MTNFKTKLEEKHKEYNGIRFATSNDLNGIKPNNNCENTLQLILAETTWAQFHQRSTYSFHACRSRNRKKILMT